MDINRPRHARRRVVRLMIALLGAVLVAPPLALAPAYAAAPAGLPGLPDPSTLLLVPAVTGAGQITGVTGLVCSNLSGVEGVEVPCSDGLSLGELSVLTGALTLVPTPAAGWEFAGWTDCATVVDDNCVLQVTDLVTGATLQSPVATFVPAAAPDPCTVVPLPTCDTTPPVTQLTQKPPVVTGNRTKEKSATFAFKAYEPDEAGNATATETTGATFECQLTGPGQTPGYTACTSPKAYPALTDGQYTFMVRALDDATTPNTDATPESFTWTVDSTAPETTFASGPGTWVLAKTAAFGLRSSEPGSSFRCALDGSGRFCTTSASVSFAPGTHTFTAFAKDAVGNEDLTAASRTFTMPLDDKGLKRSSGWKQGKGAGYFLKTFSSTTRKGATMRASSTGIRQVALVVTKGKGFGTVKVYLGKTLLKKVSLAASSTRKKKLVKVASFATATSGTVKVVVTSKNKKVVIDGLGIATG